jgi:hypothetical protein
MSLGDYYVMSDPELSVGVWTPEATALHNDLNFLSQTIVMENLNSYHIF